ncbi:MAG: hypothetical protein QXN71_00700 [Candidatus Aenigmatarchaeota archaeon]
MDFKNIKPAFSWRPVIYCVLINIIIAFVAFSVSFLLTANPVETVLYTFYTWSATVTGSFIYWIAWFFRNVKSDGKVKAVFTVSMLVLLAIEWLVIWNVLGIF